MYGAPCLHPPRPDARRWFAGEMLAPRAGLLVSCAAPFRPCWALISGAASAPDGISAPPSTREWEGGGGITWATASRSPRVGWGGVPAMVFGVTTPTASPLLAVSDARYVCGLTHPGAVKLLRFRVHTIDRGHSLSEITGFPDCWGHRPPAVLETCRGNLSRGRGRRRSALLRSTLPARRGGFRG